MMKDLGSFKERNAAAGIGRSGIAAEVFRVVGKSKAEVRGVLDEILNVVQVALESGKRVELRGFGTLVPHRSNARRSFVPTKGKVVKVDARWKVVFKTSKDLKASLMNHLEG